MFEPLDGSVCDLCSRPGRLLLPDDCLEPLEDDGLLDDVLVSANGVVGEHGGEEKWPVLEEEEYVVSRREGRDDGGSMRVGPSPGESGIPSRERLRVEDCLDTG